MVNETPLGWKVTGIIDWDASWLPSHREYYKSLNRNCLNANCGSWNWEGWVSEILEPFDLETEADRKLLPPPTFHVLQCSRTLPLVGEQWPSDILPGQSPSIECDIDVREGHETESTSGTGMDRRLGLGQRRRTRGLDLQSRWKQPSSFDKQSLLSVEESGKRIIGIDGSLVVGLFW
ncbi:hypothetical protein ARMGADRAFT_1065257 [Armillaria gallica]|uniref:Aminoglycoside phosphotransferase domain-containing protein n=1 Tax=Armillaria gallica TaxID=47427 RepID=A0A2H3D444_ARMGA|nr:hypothetical protein ARMGADRAFT_1065257 [Armillaria gallica]